MSYEPYPTPGPDAGFGQPRPDAAYEATTAVPVTPAFASTPYSEPNLTGNPTDETPSTADKAHASAQAGKQAAGEVAQTASEKVQDVAAETKQQARNVLSQAQDQLKDQAAQQHRTAVDNLRALADELSSMAQRSEQQGPATDLVGQAGDRAHSAASWLDAREPGQLVGELRSFARRRPGTFLVGALAAGVLAGRLTRGAIAAHSDDTSASDATQQPAQQAVQQPAQHPTHGYDASVHQNAPQYPATPAVGVPQAEYAPGFGGVRP